jgi:hypothetical protein
MQNFLYLLFIQVEISIININAIILVNNQILIQVKLTSLISNQQ